MEDLFNRLAKRSDRRTEADIQADVRQFILAAPLELEDRDLQEVHLESQLGDRRRIDIEAGSTVIEVKRDLRRERIRRDAEQQLAGYVQFRTDQTGLRYIGVLTDGTIWAGYDLVDEHLRLVSELNVESLGDGVDRLIVWLEGVLATARDIAPTDENIRTRLGSGSSAYALDRAALASLYGKHKKNPTVQLKRTLWSRLLTSALGTQFEDSDDLFVEHTLLVNSSEIIAHAVLGLTVEVISPVALLGGEKFDEAGIYGVVEPDFFDWVVEVDGGSPFIRTLARRLTRFAWHEVEQDVLKVLYESIIGPDTRKRLGEYYTPDWLADVVVSETVPDPLDVRVLDPACGSGTFLFYAVRNYVAAAEKIDTPIKELLEGVTRHVIGMDLHPVAVMLARVTYLLAIGRNRLLDPARGTLQIPVYLGDSLQWQEQRVDLWAAGNLVIRTDDQRELFGAELAFPDALLSDAAKFDQLVNELADKASKRTVGSVAPSLNALFARLAIPDHCRPVVERTFKTMCRLHDEGRDHIWGYYVRNLARPMWLSHEENHVDVIVGNPPWLAYRHMTPDMQDTFRALSEARGLWAGAEVATHQDLSALFVTRACELYLRKGGRFGLVLPNAALDRDHYAGFRRGHYGDTLAIAFDRSWDLRRIRPHFFPRAASVVFGRRVEYSKEAEGRVVHAGNAMPEEVEIWTGRLRSSTASWSEAAEWVTRSAGKVRYTSKADKSLYAPAFTQGATFTPRVAFVVEKQATSSLGIPQGRLAVRSSRSIQEKKPWKALPDLEGVVESEFVRPFFTGDNVFPFRIGEPFLAVLPITSRALLDPESADSYPGLQQWWRKANELWEHHKSSDRMSLMERLDYQSTLSKQIPLPELRVVYNRSGMHVVAAKITNRRAIIANGLYWAAVGTVAEADFLCAILNAPTTTELTRPLMSYGKDERDIHKHVWELPIPVFDMGDSIHRRLSQLGQLAERQLQDFAINPSLHFAATRRHMREALETSDVGRELDELVFELIG